MPNKKALRLVKKKDRELVLKKNTINESRKVSKIDEQIIEAITHLNWILILTSTFELYMHGKTRDKDREGYLQDVPTATREECDREDIQTRKNGLLEIIKVLRSTIELIEEQKIISDASKQFFICFRPLILTAIEDEKLPKLELLPTSLKILKNLFGEDNLKVWLYDFIWWQHVETISR